MKVRKAIIPAAGLGTRVLPASKAIPKEMLSIVDKPAIQYIVEEAARAGIEEILIITSRGKSAIEDHFDRSPELEERLERTGKRAMLEEIRAITKLANIQYVRQAEMKGLGHAVLCAKSFAAGEPVAVLYGDDVIIGDSPACGELCEAYERYGKGVIGVKEVPIEEISKYGSARITERLSDRAYAVDDMVEKPKPEEAPSPYAILGRCVLPPEIFDYLERTTPGAGGEIQLTDAMRALTHDRGMVAYEYTGTRYDMGNKLGILQATVEVGLQHPEVGSAFRDYLKSLLPTL